MMCCTALYGAPQGEDVVAGIRTPLPIAHMGQIMPKVYEELCTITTNLEKSMKDMQVRVRVHACMHARWCVCWGAGWMVYICTHAPCWKLQA